MYELEACRDFVPGHKFEEFLLFDYQIFALLKQIGKAWKEYSFKGPNVDLRPLILKFFKILPLIFNRHLKFLCWGVQNFLLVLNLIWGCSKYDPIALFASWNNSGSQCLFLMTVWFLAFSSNIALSASWKLLDLLHLGSEHRSRRIVSTTFVQDLNRASPATFRIQIFSRKYECS